ncbi:DUF4097 family beta strand repeat-containing protein [Staphylococcus caeli]|uniref:DUF4097 domain-containing protein n=1 Tax=Staphylococcus caeli TaxID=2201815 RepID=A0A1D4K574_9STAP|nr:DUF4097 family beta strand repeat-containing protein [Staphylococcus caeli]SCS69148.1 Uncharacterised protein [Staphylococcus caeli]SCS79393.1 Uncharacterised protein [Staphylococcus caeli]
MKKALIIIFIISFIITVVCGIGAVQKFKEEYKKANQITTNFNEIYNDSKIKSADIKFKNSNLTIKKGDKFKVTSKGSNDKIKIDAKIKGNKLILNDYKGTSNINISFLNLRYNDVVVTVPKKLKNLDVSSDNGHINIQHIEADEAQLFSDIGNLKLNHSKFNNIIATGDTAAIDLKHTMFNRGEFKTDTGDVYIKQVPADKPIQVRTDTGDVELEYGQSEPKNSQIDFIGDSGELDIEHKRFKGKKVGHGDNHITIETDTGDATIK